MGVSARVFNLSRLGQQFGVVQVVILNPLMLLDNREG